MLSSLSAFLGLSFLASETGLAIWRRASSKDTRENVDGGSLRLLWFVISAAITAGVFLAAHDVGPRLLRDSTSAWTGGMIFLAGAILRWWAVWHLGRFFTVQVTLAQNHRVIDTGPYRLIRHPSYTGLLLQFSGLGVALNHVWSLVAVAIPPTLALLYRIRIEEKALLHHLDDAYAAYMRRTKKLVPLLF